MALTLASQLSVRQKALETTRAAASQAQLRTLFSYLSQHKPGIELQFVPVSGLDSADVVVADVACRLYALFLRKPTSSATTAYVKGSDHASAQGANAELGIMFLGTGGGGQEACQCYPAGLMFGTGLTLDCHTTSSGTTKSDAADAPVGFAIVGSA
jgi:hypothetical protein